MKNCLLLGALLMGFTGVAMAQSVTVDAEWIQSGCGS